MIVESQKINKDIKVRGTKNKKLKLKGNNVLQHCRKKVATLKLMSNGTQIYSTANLAFQR